VFDAWFDPNAVGAWLFATPGGISKHVEIDACVGGGFAIHEQRGDSLATHFGTYLEIVRPNRIVFTFGTERQESTTVMMVDIRPDSGGGGLLTLTHRLDPEWAALDASIRAGWASILEGLARATGEPGNGHTLILHRTFDAPRILVWKAWTEAEHMTRWLCPTGFRVLFAEVDLKTGGKWRSGMRSPEGNEYVAGGEYREIRQPSRLVLTHKWERNDLEPRATTDNGHAERARWKDRHDLRPVWPRQRGLRPLAQGGLDRRVRQSGVARKRHGPGQPLRGHHAHTFKGSNAPQCSGHHRGAFDRRAARPSLARGAA
jgi:uncharacterized protein YndB with AHSA1/START domain